MKTIYRYGIVALACFGSLLAAYLIIGARFSVLYEAARTHALSLPLPALLLALLFVYGTAILAAGRLWSTVGSWHTWVGGFFISLYFLSGSFIFLLGYHMSFIALFLSLCLLVPIIPLFMGAWEIDRLAAYLFIPYTLWIFYAIYFVVAVWMLW